MIFLAFDNQTIETEALEKNGIPYVIISENGVTCPGMAEKKAFERVIFDCIQFCRDHNLEKICYFTRSINHLHPHNKYDLIVKAIRQILSGMQFLNALSVPPQSTAPMKRSQSPSAAI